MTSLDHVSVADAAHALGITPRAVLARIHAGHLKATKIGPATSLWLIPQDELDRAVAAQQRRAASAS